MHHTPVMMQNNPFITLSPNIADVSEELRERALKRTTEMLRELVKVRRTLELPVEQLPIVIEMYGIAVIALIAEHEREEIAKRTTRHPLTMRSENRDYQPMKVVPGKITDVIARPQFLTYRPEDFAIHGDRTRWIVHDIRIGNVSQFAAKRGPAAGTEFGPGGILEHLRLETLGTAMDLVLVVEYVGPDPEGEIFEATVVGTAFKF